MELVIVGVLLVVALLLADSAVDRRHAADLAQTPAAVEPGRALAATLGASLLLLLSLGVAAVVLLGLAALGG